LDLAHDYFDGRWMLDEDAIKVRNEKEVEGDESSYRENSRPQAPGAEMVCLARPLIVFLSSAPPHQSQLHPSPLIGHVSLFSRTKPQLTRLSDLAARAPREFQPQSLSVGFDFRVLYLLHLIMGFEMRQEQRNL
jgi:hypothetical protein